METIEQYQETGRDIWNDMRLAAYPVAIKSFLPGWVYLKEKMEESAS